MYIGQRGDSLGDVPANHPAIDESYTVRAGKFRRYHGDGLKQLIDVPTIAKNMRDGSRVLVGLAESRRLLKKIKPDLVFIKGGFVGVPVGLAAAQLHIPIVTHDSDVIPGLANRIIARWATAHAVALPKEMYAYPQEKTYTVGVPISAAFAPVTVSLQAQYKQELGLEHYAHVLLVTGGGNGAWGLNQLLYNIAPSILKRDPEVCIVLLSGRKFEAAVSASFDTVLSPSDRQRVIVKGFVDDLYRWSGAADVIIARGSATNIAEFAAQEKTCIMIPAAQLIWTVKNTDALAKAGAVKAFLEKDVLLDSKPLIDCCVQLCTNLQERKTYAHKLRQFAHPQATHDLAMLLLSLG